MAYNPNDKQNILYLYDLPKVEFTSVQLAKILKEKAGVDLDVPPQVRRDITKPFYTGMLKINDPEKFKKACEELKYFTFHDKPCRALPFDKDLLGSNKQKIVDHNVFVRKIPKDIDAPKLDEIASKIGDVKSLKISLNPDYTSRGYGFICFQSPQSAEKAIQELGKEGSLEAIRYEPKDKRDMRRVFNNIYVKNFPESWTEDDLKKLFEQYGKTISIYKETNEKGAFAFVCYGDKDHPENKTYGFECAQKAVENLNGKQIDGKELYVKEALSKEDRKLEKTKEMLRYKNSKKRCNLYVKNFPPDTTKEQLEELFSKYGEIENVKLFSKGEGEAVYAFVCFKNPENASEAKSALHQTTFRNKTLYINHYEIKEIRKIQYEEMHDKTDFQNYKRQTTGVSVDIFNKPEIFALLTQIFTQLQPRFQNQMRQGRMQNRHGPGNPRFGGQRPHQDNMSHNMHQQMPHQMTQGVPPHMGRPPMAGMPQQPMMQPPMGMMPNMQQQQQHQTPQQQYAAKGLYLVPAVVKANPHYKT